MNYRVRFIALLNAFVAGTIFEKGFCFGWNTPSVLLFALNILAVAVNIYKEEDSCEIEN